MFTQRTLRFILLIGWLAAVGTAARSQQDSLAILHSFSTPSSIGYWPFARLTQAPDGSFYGTCYEGGPNGTGTIFKIGSSGPPTLLYAFSAVTGGSYYDPINADGANPGPLLLASDGNFYGTGSDGGSYGYGTIFKVTPAGSLTVLHTFDGTDGAYPRSLFQTSDGSIYGVTGGGGANNTGTIFKMISDGTVTTLYTFEALNSDYTNVNGAWPRSVIPGSDGNFYGDTLTGGAQGVGTIFKITPQGKLTTLHVFRGPEGAQPEGKFLQGPNGDFYGTTYSGGDNDNGVVFKITPKGTYTLLHSFPVDNPPNEGTRPIAGLTLGPDGNFYGTTSLGGYIDCGTIYKITPSGVLTVVHTFSLTGSQHIYPVELNTSNSNPDGIAPLAALTLGADGYFYGTTQLGGAYSYGALFKVSPSGDFHTLTSFGFGNNADGYFPTAPLLRERNGIFYGTSYGGGSYGQGTLFQFDLGGKLTTLHAFNGSDGSAPAAQPIRGSDGNLYGTTEYGGANGYGTIYRLSPSGTFTSLYSFTALDNSGSNTDGATPSAPLVEGPDGNFYGIANYGGANAAGTVFKITPNGDFTTLHTFTAADGSAPSVLILGPDGNLYGATEWGGVNGAGTIFRMTLSGTLTTLYSFQNTTDGQGPDALFFGPGGNLYGATMHGGSLGGGYGGDGTVFKLTLSGSLTTLTTFSSPYMPLSLVKGGNGDFYGLGLNGGSAGGGNVFEVTPTGTVTDLYDFYPYFYSTPLGGITLGPGGRIYGVSTFAGQFNFGNIYRLRPPGP